MLEVPEVIRCVLLCMLEAVDGGLCLLEAMRRVMLCITGGGGGRPLFAGGVGGVGGAGRAGGDGGDEGAGGDAMYATLYAEGDALYATLYAGDCGGWALGSVSGSRNFHCRNFLLKVHHRSE